MSDRTDENLHAGTARVPPWLAPQVIVAGLLCLAALVFAVRAPGAPDPPAMVEVEVRDEIAAEPTEVEVVIVEPGGLERVAFVETVLPADDTARYAAIIDALLGELMEADLWPPNVPAPRVFVQRAAGADVLVLDTDVPGPVEVDVEAELRIVGSIDATASRHGASVRYLVNGRAGHTLFGHVAVPSTLAGP